MTLCRFHSCSTTILNRQIRSPQLQCRFLALQSYLQASQGVSILLLMHPDLHICRLLQSCGLRKIRRGWALPASVPPAPYRVSDPARFRLCPGQQIATKYACREALNQHRALRCFFSPPPQEPLRGWGPHGAARRRAPVCPPHHHTSHAAHSTLTAPLLLRARARTGPHPSAQIRAAARGGRRRSRARAARLMAWERGARGRDVTGGAGQRRGWAGRRRGP